MGNAFRRQPGPSLYDIDNRTPVSKDFLEVGIPTAFGLIAFSFLLIIPGIRGWKRIRFTIKTFSTLWLGTVILSKDLHTYIHI